jgi:hypothetical protein
VAVQKLGSFNPYPEVVEVHRLLPRRVHFPVEPSPDEEGNVRSVNLHDLTEALIASAKSSSFTGPTPETCLKEMNSRKRFSVRLFQVRTHWLRILRA